MNAVLRPAYTRVPMTAAHVDAVVEIERAAYAFPWSRGNFIDSLAAGYPAELLLDPEGALVAYTVAMHGVEELHLLNLTVAPAWQRQGHGTRMLDALVASCGRTGAHRLWLEVRVSNAAARSLYARYGFSEAGLRRGYYPAALGRREDAVVMRLALGGGGLREDRDDLV